MDGLYIRKIETHNLRNIKDTTINVGEEKRHLIITGPNGSGKTTFVNELAATLNAISTKDALIKDFKEKHKLTSYSDVLSNEEWQRVHSYMLNDKLTQLPTSHSVVPDIVNDRTYWGKKFDNKFIVYSSNAHRKGEFDTPNGPTKMSGVSVGKKFIQLLVNMETQRAYAYADNDNGTVERINQWFVFIKNAVGEFLGNDDFELKFIREEYNFEIIEKGKEPYRFTQLSDGYSAILAIVSDLFLRMGTDPITHYDMPGIAIIDEIETHLHVELQRKILPFLTQLFPNIQFIVTTHSPFVLSSLESATIFDIKSLHTHTDLSKYSYSSLIEGYFDSSQYSQVIIERIKSMEERLKSGKIDDGLRKDYKELNEQISDLEQGGSSTILLVWKSLQLKYRKVLDGNL